MESCSEYTGFQLLLIGMPCSGPSPAAGLTSIETSWTFALVDAMRSGSGGQWRTRTSDLTDVSRVL